MALTRKQMEAVIRGGGTVLYKGRGITNINNLPSAAAMAETEEEKQAAEKDLDAEIARLQKQKATLGEKSKKNTAEDKLAEKKDAK